jgi:hypothetical protein
MGRLQLVVLAVVAVLIGTSATALHRRAEHDAERQSLPPHVARPAAGAAQDYPDIPGAYDAAVAAWAAEQERQIGAYLASLEAERLEAEARARRAVPAAPRSVGGTVGDCTGFAIPDYIIQRESGGNPSAYNPSGAYGCAQTLLSHYTSGSCRGLDPYTIEGQRQCVWILSNGGTNLAPWAATR